MLVNADAKSLEWVCAALLSQDPVAVREILNLEDQHTDNQDKFGLPSRLVAKTFLFRIIYGGSSKGFANDPNFGQIGSEKYWQKAIDAFYEKYTGIKAWHSVLMRTVIETGEIRSPTGRVYRYPQMDVIRKPDYWRPKILNYCVQGLGADLMALVRTILREKLMTYDPTTVLMINTVHDSIVLDTTSEMWYNISTVVKSSFDEVPARYEQLFGTKFPLPMRAEISYGMDWKNMEEIEI